MKLKITTNFSFSKLANNLPELLRKYSVDYAVGAEKGTKENINNSVNTKGKKLTSYTARKEGRKPLISSGKMFNSIKSKQGELAILEYGYKHNQGEWANVRKETNVKDFIGATKNYQQEVDKKFMDNINKALKK